MVLLIDNYDSFSYNLYQLVGEINPDIMVIRNDEMTVEDIEKLAPSHIILSPGPGRPSEAGVCQDVVRKLGRKIPILGVCLGHQAICEAYGATVTYAGKLMHGKQSVADIVSENRIFKGLERQIKVARYHSLAAKKDTLPIELKVTAITEDGEVMAVEHATEPVFGLQFHPESILTDKGREILNNFMEVKVND